MKKMREDFVMFQNADKEWFLEQDKDNTLTEVKLHVKKPNHEQQRESNFIYSKYMNKYLAAKIMPQIRLGEILRENGVWNDEKAKKENELILSINNVREKLKKGGIKLSEGMKLAKEGIKLNFELMNFSMQKNAMLNDSAETLAQNDKFNYLVSQCTVYSNDGRPVFRDYEQYQEWDNLDSHRLLTYNAGQVFSKLIYNMEDDFRADWPEYKFLKKHGFVNDKLQFLKDGKVVDFDGNPVVEETQVEETTEEPVFLED